MKLIKPLLSYEVRLPMLQFFFLPSEFPSQLGCLSLFCSLLNWRVNNQLPWTSLHSIHFHYDFFSSYTLLKSICFEMYHCPLPSSTPFPSGFHLMFQFVLFAFSRWVSVPFQCNFPTGFCSFPAAISVFSVRIIMV